MEGRLLLSTGPVPNYSGTGTVQTVILQFGSGVSAEDWLTADGIVHYSYVSYNSTYSGVAYSPSALHGRVVQIVPAGDLQGDFGVDTLFNDGFVTYSYDGTNLDGSGQNRFLGHTIAAIAWPPPTGTPKAVQLVPVGLSGGVDTRFNNGEVTYSTDGTNLDLNGSNSTSSQNSHMVAAPSTVVDMAPVIPPVPTSSGASPPNRGVDTLFADGTVYFSSGGTNLKALKAYNGTLNVVQIVPVGSSVVLGMGVDALLGNGDVYLSTDGMNLGTIGTDQSGGTMVLAYAGSSSADKPTQLFAVGSNGGVDTLFQSGHVYFSPDGSNLGGGGTNQFSYNTGQTVSAYTGTQKVVEMVAYEGGILTQFSGAELYFSPDGKNAGGGSNGSVGTVGIAYGVTGFYIEAGPYVCPVVISYPILPKNPSNPTA